MGNRSSNSKQQEKNHQTNRIKEDSGPEYIGASDPPPRVSQQKPQKVIHPSKSQEQGQGKKQATAATTAPDSKSVTGSKKKVNKKGDKWQEQSIASFAGPSKNPRFQETQQEKEGKSKFPIVTSIRSMSVSSRRLEATLDPVRGPRKQSKSPASSSKKQKNRSPKNPPQKSTPPTGYQQVLSRATPPPPQKLTKSSEKNQPKTLSAASPLPPPPAPPGRSGRGRTPVESKAGNSEGPPVRRGRSESARALARGFVWVTCQNGNCPKHAVEGGNIFADKTLVRSLVIARAYVGSELVPGYFDTRDKVCCVSWNGHPYKVTGQYQVLSALPGQFRWRESQDGVAEEDAVEGGVTSDGEALLIGRAQGEILLHKFLATGRIQPSRKCLYVANGYKLTIPKEDEDPNLLKGHFKLILSEEGTEDYHDTYQYLAHPTKAELTKAVRSTRSFFSKSLP